MSDKKYDGGPAFPRPASEYTKNGTLPDGNDAVAEQAGMTLRDYFAAKAMQGLLASDDPTGPFYSAKEVAEFSYEQADAMLAERGKGGE